MREKVKLFIQELEKHNMPHLPLEEKDGHIIVPLRFRLQNTKMEIIVAFDKDQFVAIRCYGLLRVNEEQFPQALLCCNKLNQEMRWVKFYVDDDGEINIEDDAIVDNITAGEEVFELVMRMASIADEAYPVFNRSIWF